MVSKAVKDDVVVVDDLYITEIKVYRCAIHQYGVRVEHVDGFLHSGCPVSSRLRVLCRTECADGNNTAGRDAVEAKIEGAEIRPLQCGYHFDSVLLPVVAKHPAAIHIVNLERKWHVDI